MSLYYMEHYRTNDVQIRRGVLRIDGLTSVQANFAGGEFVTRPLTFTGEQLTINYATSAAGSVKVEVQDATGTPIPGFTLDDCPELYGDRLDQTVNWTAGSSLKTLAGQTIRLRFVMRDADLYALQFVSGDR
jgi:hypothetical protein